MSSLRTDPRTRIVSSADGLSRDKRQHDGSATVASRVASPPGEDLFPRRTADRHLSRQIGGRRILHSVQLRVPFRIRFRCLASGGDDLSPSMLSDCAILAPRDPQLPAPPRAPVRALNGR